jgi:hypothetical protein
MHERIIVARRWKSVATLPLAGLAIGLGLWTLWNTTYVPLEVAGWVAVFFGVAALPVLLVQFIRPSRLRLSEQALILDTSLSKPKVIPWRDVEGFYVWRTMAARRPAFRYVDGYKPRHLIGKPLRDRAGVDGALRAAWPLAPEALVNVLNQYRLHYGR